MSVREFFDPRELDQRAVFKRLHEDDARRTASGARVPDWRALTTCWAKVDGVSGTEGRAGDQDMRQIAYRVSIREEVAAQAGIREKDRVEVLGMVLDIVSVPQNGRRGRLVVIECAEGASEG